LLLSGAVFLRLFRFGNLLCGHSEMALKHNPLLLAAQNWYKSKPAGQLTQYVGALSLNGRSVKTIAQPFGGWT